MSNTIIIFIIIFVKYLDNCHSCDLLNSIDIQSVTYSHSLILRVQPLNISDELNEKFFIQHVLIREIIKNVQLINYEIQINDIIIIRIDKEFFSSLFEDSCWQLLHESHMDRILFLNETNSNQFDLRFPPIQSTSRTRENIDSVIDYDAYSPQVLIKPRLTRAYLSQNYSLQCLVRGNPLPRLYWTKTNQTFEYYPTKRQCETTTCRIYSIQSKYQSILYFRFLTHTDSGLYTCHAENAINHTLVSIYIHVNSIDENLTCTHLNNCHQRGQCLFINKQFKCLCVNPYFGDQCEMNSDDLIRKPNSRLILFRSRFLIICLCGFFFLLIIFFSCIFTRNASSSLKCDRKAEIIEQSESSSINNKHLVSLDIRT